MSYKTIFTAILAASALSVGCTSPDAEDSENVADAAEALTVENGHQMNGTYLNGSFLNGVRYNGVRYNGVRYNGVRYNGVRYNGTALEGTLENTSILVTDVGFAGSDLDAVLGDGSDANIHIASISTTDVPGMLAYEITAGGDNVCGSSGAKALLLPGNWNYATGGLDSQDANYFTVACRGAAIAKCAEWGYHDLDEWSETDGSTTQHVAGTYFHEACVRMVRADYCGDGHSHTQNGTAIDVYDVAGIQTPDSSMALEAEWSASGAKCVKHVRWTSAAYGDVESYIKDHCDAAWAGSDRSAANAACGSSSSTYFTANGINAALATRPLLRNKSDVHSN